MPIHFDQHPSPFTFSKNVMSHHRYSTASLIWIVLIFLWLPAAAAQSSNAYLPEVSFDFGIVRQGEVVEHRFAFRNPSTLPVKPHIVGLSHPGMRVKAVQEIAPGAEASVVVTWDTRSVHGDATAKVLLWLTESQSISLTLSARVVPPIDILPYSAVFISGFRDERAVRTLEIVNNEDVPLNIAVVTGTEAASVFSANLRTVEPGRHYLIDVELKSDAPAGKSQQVLEILTDDPRFPIIRTPVNAFVKEEVYVNPESVEFGSIAGGAPSQETFFLKKRHGRIEILSIESDLPYLKIMHSQDDAGSSHQLIVDLQGSAVTNGPIVGHIYIKTDDPVFPEITVPVQGELNLPSR